MFLKSVLMLFVFFVLPECSFFRVRLHEYICHFMSVERSEEIDWVECFYWVLTTMSTLGYGDITFNGK